ncbi:anaerobic ribonucleoside-triphosphate reductase [Tetragenococcus halophilus subsp. halophilus]|uniref:Anaerobic ribonucleoside-triphosphate reductase n=1 Tax=Tetragenococcus halophilus (strain DSM 20338 / JCM 20259 / NCIMB 9735 / NBRC 12172) TaxID=945021 RepID=A0AAN1SFJ2_TETHN|nr:anaerobic ribonucleoside-triphosphate reductase [Tetragenococcus halophilus]MCF1601334.1 anaerobic ribonucleoside-triphosphate reductase [Tetragenococcus halophilus]MCF1674748.1 anaerobic ribonucleoside-triphosphate reductase [Tetragenococcus halophilus]MCO7025947.1 anaerobic ribonucleoside-triphosphate reductase [Tetragenococcus halophilus]MDN5831093.1 anaerobic ribonucleoside-triphosphate reductase [Tetragenococcus halophilus]MDN6111535.1 anaerobic ribonucleoside-triphosphate reductase [T
MTTKRNSEQSISLSSQLSDMKVIKRDGRLVNFNAQKIYDALLKAKKHLEGNLSPLDYEHINRIVEQVISEINYRFQQNVKIYEIQNIVEHTLLENHEYELAQEYINYRTQRDFKRSQATDINFSIDQLMGKEKTVVNENANKDSDVFNTQRDLTAGIVGKSIGLKMLPPHVANAHQKGDIHYHDLDYQPYAPMTNCCLIDFKGMLNNGFKIGNAEVEPPKSIQTATAQISQIIANVASSQYGGCSADRLDETLAPFAKLNYQKHLKEAKIWIEDPTRQKEFAMKKTKKDIFDAMQSLEYEINTLFTSNGQTPFTSVGFGLGTDWFAREIQRAILQNRINGLGSEQRTAIFPKLIFSIKSGTNLNPEDPNYDIKQLALECATKRMYPDILNYDKIVKLTGSFKVPMGCRSFLQGWENEQGEEVNVGRMNLGVVTINLPRIAMQAEGDIENFWKILDERLSIAKDALVYRVERCKQANPANAPILYMYGAFGKRLGREESVNELFKNKRATVSLGYIGLYEVASAFYGQNWESNEKAKNFTLDIVKKLKNNTDQWGDEYGYHFSVYCTPSESLTDRFCRLDTEKFGTVKNITDKEYYTNSFHYDIRKDPTPFEKLDFEKDYPKYCSGGFIHYCEYPVLQQNPKALEAVWDYSYDRVGYLGTNTPIDHCYECGFEGDFKATEKGFECPQCGNHDPKTCDVVKRTCGYLGNPQARPMVHGRHKEIASRVKHMGNE